HGKADGTGRIITTMAGFIITMSPVFILMWTLTGEDTTETMIGMDTDGTMNGSHTGSSERTGRAGRIIDTGKDNESGTSGTINIGLSSRYRNRDVKAKSSIKRGLRSSDIGNRCKSDIDKSSPRSSNTSNNLSNRRDSSPRSSNSKDNPGKLNISIINLRGNNLRANSSTRGNHNISSPKENLKDGMKKRESRRTRGLNIAGVKGIGLLFALNPFNPAGRIRN
ncbi:MAG TPA: hypothetical protein VMT12_07290, partial [Syntrophales bacterium]|nr:hypothetical protein [Syntrophales bacterium]